MKTIEIKPMARSKQHVDYIDYAKGIGIFLVVWGHVITYQQIYGEPQLILKNIIYSFHMPLFFMLSGIGMWYKLSSGGQLPSMRSEAKRLAIKLLLPYAFWAVIYNLFTLTQNILTNPKVFHATLGELYVTFSGMLPPMWFLVSLFIAQLCLMQLCRVLRSYSAKMQIFAEGGGTAFIDRINLIMQSAMETHRNTAF